MVVGQLPSTPGAHTGPLGKTQTETRSLGLCPCREPSKKNPAAQARCPFPLIPKGTSCIVTVHPVLSRLLTRRGSETKRPSHRPLRTRSSASRFSAQPQIYTSACSWAPGPAQQVADTQRAQRQGASPPPVTGGTPRSRPATPECASSGPEAAAGASRAVTPRKTFTGPEKAGWRCGRRLPGGG